MLLRDNECFVTILARSCVVSSVSKCFGVKENETEASYSLKTCNK